MYWSVACIETSCKVKSKLSLLLFIGNEEVLNLIDSAAFNLVLEDGDSEDPKELSQMFLYGDASNR